MVRIAPPAPASPDPRPNPDPHLRCHARTFEDLIEALVGGAFLPDADVRGALRGQGHSDRAIGWFLGTLALVPRALPADVPDPRGHTMVAKGSIVWEFGRDADQPGEPGYVDHLLDLMRTLDGWWERRPPPASALPKAA